MAHIWASDITHVSSLLKTIGLFCRISCLLLGSFAKETYNFKEPTNRRYCTNHSVSEWIVPPFVCMSLCEYVWRDALISVVWLIRMIHSLSDSCPTYGSDSCPTYGWVTPHVRTSHGTRMNKWHHTWVTRAPHTDESRHMYERVTPHYGVATTCRLLKIIGLFCRM